MNWIHCNYLDCPKRLARIARLTNIAFHFMVQPFLALVEDVVLAYVRRCWQLISRFVASPTIAPFETKMHTSLLLRALSPLLALLIVLPARSEDLSREYRIKAAYLYNLSKFIVWPGEDTLPKEVPIKICVYGYNPFDNYLDKLRERPVRGRMIAIRYVQERESIDDCQMLFVSQHNTATPKLLNAAPPYPPILTVSDDEDFLTRGGLVSLVTVNNNVQLDINLTRAKQTGFSVSANLLEIAHRIQ